MRSSPCAPLVLSLTLMLVPGCALAQARAAGRSGPPPQSESSPGDEEQQRTVVQGPPPLGALPAAGQGGATGEAARSPAVELATGASTRGGSVAGAAAAGPEKADAAALRAARLAQLQGLVSAELSGIRAARARVSLLVEPLGGPDQADLLAEEPEAQRVPASNAKLLTSTAAALVLPGRFGFTTEVSRAGRGGTLHLWGTGDPLLSGGDINRLARQVRAAGVTSVQGIVVDDGFLGQRRLAPGFSSFEDGSRYRPTSGAINLDGNSVVVKVSASKDRRQPRVDVLPPSDYVKVNKKVRFASRSRGKAAGRSSIRIQRKQKGSIMWLTISGVMGRGAAPWTRRFAVYDPALNAGWALRRALTTAGVKVKGTVSRGRRSTKGKVVARVSHSLASVLLHTNRDSDNLAAETLVRAMGVASGASREPARGNKAKTGSPDDWERGLAVLKAALDGLGITQFRQVNGSGLARDSWVTARAMVDLLRNVHDNKGLRQWILPTLATAGRSGTLARRLRGGAAEGVVHGKTGTLGNALALSGYIDPEGKKPLVFSLLVNGTASRSVRARMDNIVELLARFSREMPLVEGEAEAARTAGEKATEPDSPLDEESEGPAAVEPEPEPDASPATGETAPGGSAAPEPEPGDQP